MIRHIVFKVKCYNNEVALIYFHVSRNMKVTEMKKEKGMGMGKLLYQVEIPMKDSMTEENAMDM